MGNVNVLALMAVAIFIAQSPSLGGGAPSAGMCVSQFALVSQTCAVLTRGSSSGSSPALSAGFSAEGTTTVTPQSPPFMTNFAPPPPPLNSAASEDSSNRLQNNDNDKGNDTHHHHHHHHHHHRRHGPSAAQEECCNWLKQLDATCVCEVLLAHLPSFLTTPGHSYTVSLGDTCVVTYEC